MNRVNSYILFCLLTFLSCFYTHAQTNKTDSLLILLQQNNDDTTRINLLHNLFFEYEFEDRDKAQKLALEALSLSKKIKYIKGQVQSNTYLGYLEQDIGNFEKGINYHKKSLKIAEDNNYLEGIALALGNIGSIYHAQCNYPQALSYYLKSLKLDESSGNKSSISIDYGNIGLVYYDQGNLDKAKEYYFKASEMAKVLGDKMGMARHIGNLATLYHQQEQFTRALELYTAGLKIAEELDSKSQISVMLGNIGEAYHDFGKLEKINSRKSDSLYSLSLKYLFRGLKMKEELGDKKGIAIITGNIGSIFIKQKKHSEAEEHLLKALSLTKEIGVLDISLAVEDLLSDLYEQTNRYQLSLQHYKQYTLLKESIFNTEKEKELTQHEMTYEFEKKQTIMKAEQDKKEAIVSADKKRQKLLLFLAGAIALAIAIIASIIFGSLRTTRKQKSVIEIQKELVEEKQKEILDSIYYARRIQRSLLPTEKYIDKSLKRLVKN